MAEETLVLRIKMNGGREVAVQNDAVAASFERVGKGEAFAAEKAFVLGESQYSLKRWAFWAVTSLGLTAGAVLKLGFSFDNAKREGVEALTAITGSARLAQAEVGQLVRITHTSGLGLDFLVNETKTMLAFGYSIKTTNEYLQAFADFAGKKGLGQSGVTSLVNLFNRVHDQGFFTGRDIRSLQGLGIPADQALDRALGLTPQQMYLLTHGQLQLSAGAALPAIAGYINQYANRQPYGLSQLFSIFRGDISQSLGGAETPLFGWARRELSGFVTGFNRGGFRGGLLGADPSGTLLAFVVGLKNAGTVLERTVGVIWRAAQPLVIVFGGVAKIVGAVTSNLTLMRLIIEPLIGLYIADRAQSAYRIFREKLLGATAETTSGRVVRLGEAAQAAAVSLGRLAETSAVSSVVSGTGAAGAIEGGAAGGLFARLLGKAGIARLAGGLGEGAAIIAMLNLAGNPNKLSRYDSWSWNSLEHGFGLFQGSTWKNALAEMGVPGIGYTAPSMQSSQALRQAIKDGMQGVTFHGTLQTPDRQKLADLVFQGKQDTQART